MTASVRRAVRGGLMLAVGGVFAACGSDSPTAPEVQVIEEVEFAASLGIDLTQMTVLSSGVYIQDLVVGTGAALMDGDSITVSYTGWTTNAFQFDMGTLDYTHPNAGFIQGWTLGMAGQLEGTTRRVIMPPDLGYGASGRGAIPPGSVLIFEIALQTIH